MKLAEIVENGDDLETLKTLRSKIADTIDNSNSGRDIAALSRQLQLVMESIAKIEEERRLKEDDTILDIVRRKHPVRTPNGMLPKNY